MRLGKKGESGSYKLLNSLTTKGAHGTTQLLKLARVVDRMHFLDPISRGNPHLAAPNPREPRLQKGGK